MVRRRLAPVLVAILVLISAGSPRSAAAVAERIISSGPCPSAVTISGIDFGSICIRIDVSPAVFFMWGGASWLQLAVLDPAVAAFTSGSVPFAGPTGFLTQDNANFFWDDTTNRLRLGPAITGALTTLSIQQATGEAGLTLQLFSDTSNDAWIELWRGDTLRAYWDRFGLTNFLGNEAVPSYTFRSDTDTGMWSSGPDTIDWSTNAVKRLTLSTTALTLTSGDLLPLTTVSALGGASNLWARLYMDFTNTATVGAVTINKPTGRVNIAAAGTSVVVTNSRVTAASHVFAVMSSADATGRVISVVPAAGSFTINTVAVTAQASFDFVVINAD